MELPFSKNLWRALTVISMAVILFISIFLGLSSGKKSAQSQDTILNANQFVKALDYFYNDQDRFPTAAEWDDKNIFGLYTTALASDVAGGFESGQCPQVFSYKRPYQNGFQLSFCLPQAAANFKVGSNQVSETR